MSPIRRNDSAAAEMIGALALIAVLVTAVAIIAVILFSQPATEKMPAMSLAISNQSKIVAIVHEGGDPLTVAEMEIRVDDNVIPPGTTPGTWSCTNCGSDFSIGDSIRIDFTGVPAYANTNPNKIDIIYKKAGQQFQLLASRNLGTLTPTPTAGTSPTTATPVPTTTPTPTPVPVPLPRFSGVPASGAPPLAVQFTDTSLNTPTSWKWDFGDGNTTGNTLQNPQHLYTSIGIYTVILNATNAFGSNSTTYPNYITVYLQPPVAGFTGVPVSGNRPLSVTFTDTSTQSPTGWLWNFGDGNTTGNTLQNPVHLYRSSGSYSVTLNASNAAGSSEYIRTNYITVSLPPRQTIFFDNFETLRPSANGWTESGSIDWGAYTPRNGTNDVRFRQTESITRPISTAGYTNITVSFAWAAQSLESGEYVRAEYSTNGGSSWTTLSQISGVVGGSTPSFTYYTSPTLPVAADNNSAFRLRFRIQSSATNDYAYIDDVHVIGLPG